MRSWLKLVAAIAAALIFWDNAGEWLHWLADRLERSASAKIESDPDE